MRIGRLKLSVLLAIGFWNGVLISGCKGEVVTGKDFANVPVIRFASPTSSRLYVLANGGLFDAYNLKTGEEIYRQRLTLVGSGFSS